MATGINFLSFPMEIQLMIYTKMDNLDIMKMSATCSRVDRFLQKQAKYLFSRIAMGDSIILEACTSGISIRKKIWTEKSMNKYLHTEDLDFYKNISPIAIKELTVVIKHYAVIIPVSDILSKWKPVCQTAGILGNIPSAYLAKMDCFIKYSEHMTLECPREKGLELFSNLKRIQNPQMHTLKMPPFFQNRTLLENIRQFGGFEMNGYVRELRNFLSDLASSQNAGNLKQMCFTLPCERREALRHPILLNIPGMPDTKLLFKTCALERVKSGGRCVLKLSLGDGYCALIRENNCMKPLAKVVDIVVMKEDEMDILNFIIESLDIDQSHFPGNSRKVLLAMNEEQRMMELQIAYASTKELRRLKNRLHAVSLQAYAAMP